MAQCIRDRRSTRTGEKAVTVNVSPAPPNSSSKEGCATTVPPIHIHHQDPYTQNYQSTRSNPSARPRAAGVTKRYGRCRIHLPHARPRRGQRAVQGKRISCAVPVRRWNYPRNPGSNSYIASSREHWHRPVQTPGPPEEAGSQRPTTKWASPIPTA